MRYILEESVCPLCFSLKWITCAGLPIDFCKFQIMKSSLWSIAKNSHILVANLTPWSSGRVVPVAIGMFVAPFLSVLAIDEFASS